MKKNIALLLILSNFLLAGCSNTGDGETAVITPPAAEKPVSQPAPNPTPEPTPTPQPKTHAFTVTGSNFSFSLKSMKVKKGDTVKVTFVNSAGTHDWRLDEFGAATKILSAGQQETVTFVADKKGQFEYYCSVGKHRAMGMKGTLTVE